jgi:hypothetical protein
MLALLAIWIIVGTSHHGEGVVEAISGVHSGATEKTCENLNFLDVLLILLGIVVAIATAASAIVTMVALPVGLVATVLMATVALFTPASARPMPLGSAMLAAAVAGGSVLVTSVGLRLVYLLIYSPMHC